MSFNCFLRNEEKIGKGETGFLLASALIFLLLMGELLWFNRRMFCHDTIGYFGLMHYFYNSLMNGILPYWDIYDYCGQPFYYNLGIARVMEMPTIALVFLNRVFNWSLLSLYHWDFIVKLLLCSAGVYMFLRQSNKYMFSNFVAFFAFMFSSFGLASLRQPGFATSFAWTPWAMWFLFRMRRSFDLYNVVGFSFFMGLLITSYQAGYSFTFFQIFIATMLVNDRKWIFAIFRDKQKIALSAFGLFIIFLLSLQLLAVFMEKDRSMPVMRQGIGGYQEGSYDSNFGGAPAGKSDYLGLIFLPFVTMSRTGHQAIPMTEATLYIGILPLALALLALALSRHKLKMNFLVTLTIIVFLSLNGRNLLGHAQDITFPFLKYARNMETFQPFFLFLLVYFVGQGADCVLERCEKYKAGQ